MSMGWLQISLDLDKFIVYYWSIHRWENGNIDINFIYLKTVIDNECAVLI